MGQNTHRKEEFNSSEKGMSGALSALGAADKALLFLRLFIGAILITEAITKSQDYLWLEGEYPSLFGFSAAEVVSVIGVMEAVAGVMIVVGFLTRPTSAIMAVVMLGAAFLFFPHQTFVEGELKVVYAGIYITLLIGGGGRYSLDAILNPPWGKMRRGW